MSANRMTRRLAEMRSTAPKYVAMRIAVIVAAVVICIPALLFAWLAAAVAVAWLAVPAVAIATASVACVVGLWGAQEWSRVAGAIIGVSLPFLAPALASTAGVGLEDGPANANVMLLSGLGLIVVAAGTFLALPSTRTALTEARALRRGM